MAGGAAPHFFGDGSMSDEATDNPTRVFIREAIDAGDFGSDGIALDINPFFGTLGATLRGGNPGNVEVGFRMGPETIQGNGVVGGGMIASMLDAATATATLSALEPGTTCATISLTVNMLGPGKAGDFRAEASVDRLGRKVGYVSGKLYDASGRLVATASCAMAIIPM